MPVDGAQESGTRSFHRATSRGRNLENHVKARAPGLLRGRCRKRRLDTAGKGRQRPGAQAGEGGRRRSQQNEERRQNANVTP